LARQRLQQVLPRSEIKIEYLEIQINMETGCYEAFGGNADVKGQKIRFEYQTRSNGGIMVFRSQAGDPIESLLTSQWLQLENPEISAVLNMEEEAPFC